MFLCFGFQTLYFNAHPYSEWKVNLHVVPLQILCQSSDFVHLYSLATAALPSEQQLSAHRAAEMGTLGMLSTESPKPDLLVRLGCLQPALHRLGLPYRPEKSSSKQRCWLGLGPPSPTETLLCAVKQLKENGSRDLILPCNRPLAAPSHGHASVCFTLRISHIKTKLQSTAGKIRQAESAFLGSDPCHLACF